MARWVSVLNAAPWRADIGRRTYPCEQSSKRAFSAKFISPSTSSWGRLKLSMAKAYTETTLTSREEHIPSICRHGVVFKVKRSCGQKKIKFKFFFFLDGVS